MGCNVTQLQMTAESSICRMIAEIEIASNDRDIVSAGHVIASCFLRFSYCLSINWWPLEQMIEAVAGTVQKVRSIISEGYMGPSSDQCWSSAIYPPSDLLSVSNCTAFGWHYTDDLRLFGVWLRSNVHYITGESAGAFDRHRLWSLTPNNCR